MTESFPPLVNVDWLADRLDDSSVVVLDASVPPVGPGIVSINRDGRFAAIPGARRFDYDGEVCRPNSALPHMMPPAELFQTKVRELGISRDSIVVVYDDAGIYASPRAWWMFRAMGHGQVAVLDGGLPAWVEAGKDTATGYATGLARGDFEAAPDEGLFCDFEVVLSAIEDSSCRILDARSAGRFHGTEPEPRPGVRGGHMPNARNLHYRDVLNDRFMKSRDELRELFAGYAAPGQKIITSCGSGITACILTLAAKLAGYDRLTVYDGSWAEWGLPSKLPVVVD